jgi:tetratricopeptide (TPR) repeat protein
MHIVLRQYAEEKLSEMPEEQEQTRDRHSQYYAEFLHQRGDHLRMGRQEEAGRVIVEEIENIRSGWRWAAQRLNHIEIEKYINPQFNFYEMRCWYKEGDEVFDLVVNSFSTDEVEEHPESQRLLAKALARQGAFAQRMGQSRKSMDLLEKALSISRLYDDKAEVAICLNYLGELTRLRGEFDKARELIEESIQICKETGELRRLGRATNLLGIVAALEGDYTEAESHFLEGLSIFKKVGDQWWMSKARENLGNVANLLGDYEKASSLYQEVLVTFRKINDLHGIASTLLNTGIMTYAMGDYEQTVDLLTESLEIFREIGVVWSSILCLNHLGKAELALGEITKADEYFYSAFKISVDIGAVPSSLLILVGMAHSFMAKGNTQRALEYLALVLSHPSSDQETRDHAEELIVELEKQIPASLITKARKGMKDTYLKQLILIADEIIDKDEEGDILH